MLVAVASALSEVTPYILLLFLQMDWYVSRCGESFVWSDSIYTIALFTNGLIC